MSVIKLSREHNLSDEDVRKIAEEMVVSLANEFGVKYHWDGDKVKFKGAGAKGYMELVPGQVNVKMELSFLLTPVKSKLEAAIVRRFDANLS